MSFLSGGHIWNMSVVELTERCIKLNLKIIIITFNSLFLYNFLLKNTHLALYMYIKYTNNY